MGMKRIEVGGRLFLREVGSIEVEWNNRYLNGLESKKEHSAGRDDRRRYVRSGGMKSGMKGGVLRW